MKEEGNGRGWKKDRIGGGRRKNVRWWGGGSYRLGKIFNQRKKLSLQEILFTRLLKFLERGRMEQVQLSGEIGRGRKNSKKASTRGGRRGRENEASKDGHLRKNRQDINRDYTPTGSV